MQKRPWLPEPPAGTKVCLGFDGSDTGDWTGIRGETIDGFSFTPRFGDRGTLWDPARTNGRIPRAEVDAAVDDLFDRFAVERFYCDPPLWHTEIDNWASRHGDERVFRWETYRPMQMHAALERFRTDLAQERITHDGCPETQRHMEAAKMSKRKDARYVLTKPDEGRKIDAAMMTVLAHEAAADARAAGWGTESTETHFAFSL